MRARRRGWVAAGACVVGLAGVACSLDLATADYASVAPPGGEAGIDASTTDGAAPDANAADGGGGTDAAPPFCASKSPAPIFCADFDHGGAVDVGWTSTSPGVSLAIDPSTSSSSPASLHAASASFAPQTGKYSSSYLTKNIHLSAVPSKVHFELAARPNRLGPDPQPGTANAFTDARIAVLTLSDTASARYVIIVSMRSNQTTMTELSGPPDAYLDHVLDPRLAVASWKRLTVDLDFAARKTSATLDGVPALGDVSMAEKAAVTQDVVLTLGLPNSYDADGGDVNLDDVLFDVE